MKDCVYLYGYGYMLIRRMSPFFQGRASYEAQRIVPIYLSQFSRSFFVSANFFVSLFSPNSKAALASSWVKYSSLHSNRTWSIVLFIIPHFMHVGSTLWSSFVC